jgi:hypothetical protein
MAVTLAATDDNKRCVCLKQLSWQCVLVPSHRAACAAACCRYSISRPVLACWLSALSSWQLFYVICCGLMVSSRSSFVPDWEGCSGEEVDKRLHLLSVVCRHATAKVSRSLQVLQRFLRLCKCSQACKLTQDRPQETKQLYLLDTQHCRRDPRLLNWSGGVLADTWVDLLLHMHNGPPINM